MANEENGLSYFLCFFSPFSFSILLYSVCFYQALPFLGVTTAMLFMLNKEIAAILVPQTNPSRIELSFYANNFF